jgi:hypothetical protein
MHIDVLCALPVDELAAADSVFHLAAIALAFGRCAYCFATGARIKWHRRLAANSSTFCMSALPTSSQNCCRSSGAEHSARTFSIALMHAR